MAYNRSIQKLHVFCAAKGVNFPPYQSGVVADFLCTVADSSDTPRSQLKTAQAAFGHMYKAFDMPNIMETAVIQMLFTALVKSATQKPMTKSLVMPIKPFRDLFCGWPENENLSIKQLRLKAITLMALTLMLRPSDIAPKSVHFNEHTLETSKCLFTTNNIQFTQTGEASIVFHGVKNDTTRTGFQVQMQPVHEPKMNPVQALRVYIDRTQSIRPKNMPVFLSLMRPHGPITASTVAQILDDAIQISGLGDQGFSAKSFRPTGATVAIETGCDPEIAMRQGR